MANRPRTKRFRSRKNSRLDWNARYGNGNRNKYIKQCAIAHKNTHNYCCYCLSARSSNLHHAYYGRDEIGVSTFPVCDRCHKEHCHSKENWIKDKNNPVWGNRNTREFRLRLQLGYELLYKGINH